MIRCMWWINAENPESKPLEQTAYVLGSGALTFVKPDRDVAAVITPTEVNGSISALLVAEELLHEVCLNGRPMPLGVHPLRHGDEVSVNGCTYWIARQASVECTTYDPVLHGENVFCFATKARLTPGQAIAICPGTDGNQCGVIYGKDAWEIACQRSASRCPSCGFDPNESEWRPTVRKPDRLLPRLMAMVARRN